MPRGIPRDKSTQHKILHRLKIVAGHLDSVIKMVEEDAYCIDVIHQSQAVQSALSQVDRIMLENHLKTCVADAIKNGDADETISEVIRVMKKRE